MSAFPGLARSLLGRTALCANGSDARPRRAKTRGFAGRYGLNVPRVGRAAPGPPTRDDVPERAAGPRAARPRAPPVSDNYLVSGHHGRPSACPWPGPRALPSGTMVPASISAPTWQSQRCLTRPCCEPVAPRRVPGPRIRAAAGRRPCCERVAQLRAPGARIRAAARPAPVLRACAGRPAPRPCSPSGCAPRARIRAAAAARPSRLDCPPPSAAHVAPDPPTSDISSQQHHRSPNLT